ncbi:hypothetical protein SCA6_017471 [Theobroma cacao]
MCSEDFTKLRQKVSLVTRGGFGADNIKSGIAMLIREAIIEANYAIASVLHIWESKAENSHGFSLICYRPKFDKTCHQDSSPCFFILLHALSAKLGSWQNGIVGKVWSEKPSILGVYFSTTRSYALK